MDNTTLDIVFNTIGTFGVVIILSAYFLLQLGKLSSTQLRYSLLNLVGAFLITLSLLHSWNLPSFIIEVCWVCISIFGVYKAIKDQKTGEKE